MTTKKLFEKIDSVSLKYLTKKFDEVYAVNNLNLEVIGGELLILIGGSGSGKTTTLKMINRLIIPDSGSIKINNIETKEFDEVTLRRNIGYVIQEIGLFPHLSVKDNIGLIPKLEGWKEEKILQRVKYLLELVDLHPDLFLNRFPNELSGGQQQRVGLARALAMNPRLLLMDEPFGALDPILRKQLQEEFIKIKKDIGRTIIFVTHDIDEAFKLGDRIAIMDNGKLIQVGTPEELILNPKNKLVADLVDADHKFRHIENLKNKDLMLPINNNYQISADLTVHKTMEVMVKHNIELAIVVKDGKFIGWISLSDLFGKKPKEMIKKFINKSNTFLKNDNLSESLLIMKKQKQSIAIITDKNIPVGIIYANEILLKLI
jgi:osmoprotectant transport system ATP-binding protein